MSLGLFDGTDHCASGADGSDDGTSWELAVCGMSPVRLFPFSFPLPFLPPLFLFSLPFLLGGGGGETTHAHSNSTENQAQHVRSHTKSSTQTTTRPLRASASAPSSGTPPPVWSTATSAVRTVFIHQLSKRCTDVQRRVWRRGRRDEQQPRVGSGHGL